MIWTEMTTASLLHALVSSGTIISCPSHVHYHRIFWLRISLRTQQPYYICILCMYLSLELICVCVLQTFLVLRITVQQWNPEIYASDSLCFQHNYIGLRLLLILKSESKSLFTVWVRWISNVFLELLINTEILVRFSLLIKVIFTYV